MHSECTAYRFYLIAVSVLIDIHPRPQYLLVPIIGVSECLPFWRGIFLLSFVTICSPVNSKLRDSGGVCKSWVFVLLELVVFIALNENHCTLE